MEKTRVEDLLDLVPIGTNIIFKRKTQIPRYPRNAENAIKVADDKYSAHPFGVVSCKDLLDMIENSDN